MRGYTAHMAGLDERERECLDRFCALLNETYPLYPECGRQLSPQFFTDRLRTPPDARTREFLDSIAADAMRVCPGFRPSHPLGA